MDVFVAIAEPSRRQLMASLLAGEAPVNALVAVTGMSQPVVSKHLKVLREAGLVVVRPLGQRRMYRLAPEPLVALADWLEPYRALWADRLDALERHLEASELQGKAERRVTGKDGSETGGEENG